MLKTKMGIIMGIVKTSYIAVGMFTALGFFSL